MTRLSDEQAVELLRRALPASSGRDPRTDLWPRVRDGVETRSQAPTLTDWILVAAVAVFCLVRPSALSLILFHF